MLFSLPLKEPVGQSIQIVYSSSIQILFFNMQMHIEAVMWEYRTMYEQHVWVTN